MLYSLSPQENCYKIFYEVIVEKKRAHDVSFLSWMTSLWGFIVSLQIHANCRIRRVYFSDRLYSEDELPAEFKLYLPVQGKQGQQVAK